MDQPTGTTSTPQKKENTQALRSLALGIVTILLFGVNFAPGSVSLIGLGGILSGILAVWQGYRGVMVDQRYRRGGSNLAYAGIGLGATGLIALVVLFAWGAHPELKPADIGIGTPRTTYQGTGFTLEYPETWEEEDLSGQPFCSQQSVECLIGLTVPTEDSSNLTFIRYQLTREVSLEEVDDFFWQMYNDNISDVKLESREEITVAGTPAVKRIYHSPAPQNAQSREYLVQVGLIHDLWYYQFTGWTDGQDAFNEYRGPFLDVIHSLEFTD